MKTLIEALEDSLATEGRRVVAVWRATLLLQAETQRLGPDERRWRKTPTVETVRPLLASRPDRFQSIEDSHGEIFRLNTAYARTSAVEDEEILMEAYPFCTLSYLTALVFHGLTDDLPSEIHATIPRSRQNAPLPPGTERADWKDMGLSAVRARPLPMINGNKVYWHRSSAAFAGATLYRPNRYPIRVTDTERTLFDAIQSPERCGGVNNVLQAWHRARDVINVGRLVKHVDAIGIKLMRQRVGFLLEALQLHHPVLDAWAAQASRGGSSRLIGSAPFESTYSERWQISLNTDLSYLYDE